MATRVIDDAKLQAIAVAVQGKDNGGVMTVDEMPTRIAAIPSQDKCNFIRCQLYEKLCPINND